MQSFVWSTTHTHARTRARAHAHIHIHTQGQIEKRARVVVTATFLSVALFVSKRTRVVFLLSPRQVNLLLKFPLRYFLSFSPSSRRNAEGGGYQVPKRIDCCSRCPDDILRSFRLSAGRRRQVSEATPTSFMFAAAVCAGQTSSAARVIGAEILHKRFKPQMACDYTFSSLNSF